MNKKKRAIEYFKESIKRDPEDGILYYYLCNNTIFKLYIRLIQLYN